MFFSIRKRFKTINRSFKQEIRPLWVIGVIFEELKCQWAMQRQFFHIYFSVVNCDHYFFYLISGQEAGENYFGKKIIFGLKHPRKPHIIIYFWHFYTFFSVT